jgi:hypothetical protein
VLYIWTLILLLNSFLHEWSRLVTPCNVLLYIIDIDLYTDSKTYFDATQHNLSVSLFRYIYTLFLLFNTFSDECSPIMTHCNELLYKVGFDLYSLNMTHFDAT